jgi:hypothetical protein
VDHRPWTVDRGPGTKDQRPRTEDQGLRTMDEEQTKSTRGRGHKLANWSCLFLNHPDQAVEPGKC